MAKRKIFVGFLPAHRRVALGSSNIKHTNKVEFLCMTFVLQVAFSMLKYEKKIFYIVYVYNFYIVSYI